VGLVLGAGTVVATHEEAVTYGYSPGPRPSQSSAAAGGVGAAAPEWQEAWQEDDGWDLSDSELLGTDGEAEEEPQAPAKPQAAAASKGAAADAAEKPQAGGAAARKSQQDSESDWES
jgi:hypothetical protein